MEELRFRTLTADEIECRVAQAGKSQKGAWCSLLLYKDARCDQRLLDETVGCFRWMRQHELINGNLFCTVSIKDDEGEWVSKQDVGTESNTEKEKGQASDAFKRACFNWGLGRELYTAPRILIGLNDKEYSEQQGRIKVSPYVSFKVSSIGYDEKRNINALVIVDSNGNVRYSMGSNGQEKRTAKANPAPSQSQVPLEDVVKEINKAATKDDLTAIFYKYTYHQSNPDFVNALSLRKNEILSNNGIAAS